MSSTEAGGGSGKRRQLGRGLSSLLGDDDDDLAPADRQRQTRAVPISEIQPGASQPRTAFNEDELEALAQSIRERGVLQPILLRRLDDERYEIIAGERRWRAAQRAQLHEIPALVREFTDTEALEVALIENVQRSDLTPLEEAQGYQRLIDEYEHTQEDIAQVVGKSRSHIANTLRLLSLPPVARDHLEAGRLTAGHARALLASPDADRLADYVVAGGLSVRATEKLVQSQARPGERADRPARKPRTTPAEAKDADTLALEQSLTETLGLAVEIAIRDAENGAVTIHYQSLEQLDDLLAKLTDSAPPLSAIIDTENVDLEDEDDVLVIDDPDIDDEDDFDPVTDQALEAAEDDDAPGSEVGDADEAAAAADVLAEALNDMAWSDGAEGDGDDEAGDEDEEGDGGDLELDQAWEALDDGPDEGVADGALAIVELDVAPEAGDGQADGAEEAEADEAPATDFDSLLAQTEAMLATGEMGDLEPKAEDGASREAADDANAGALVGSILDALDLGEDGSKAADATDAGTGETETEDDGDEETAFYIDDEDDEESS